MQMPDGAQKNVFDLFRLDGRRALVTGGSKGLGYVFAQALAEAGADVVINSRNLAECQQAADEIAKATGRRVIAIAGDVNHAVEVAALRNAAEAQLGAIDILVNNEIGRAHV